MRSQVDAYFARFHFLMPVLDKPEFMRRYTYLMDHKTDAGFIRNHTAFVASVCAVFAVASRFVDDPRLTKFDNLDDAGMGMVYYERYVTQLLVGSLQYLDSPLILLDVT